jgi:hypothetical protein
VARDLRPWTQTRWKALSLGMVLKEQAVLRSAADAAYAVARKDVYETSAWPTGPLTRWQTIVLDDLDHADRRLRASRLPAAS